MIAIALVFSVLFVLLSLVVGGLVGWTLKQHLSQREPYTYHPEMFDENGNVVIGGVLKINPNSDRITQIHDIAWGYAGWNGGNPIGSKPPSWRRAKGLGTYKCTIGCNDLGWDIHTYNDSPVGVLTTEVAYLDPTASVFQTYRFRNYLRLRYSVKDVDGWHGWDHVR